MKPKHSEKKLSEVRKWPREVPLVEPDLVVECASSLEPAHHRHVIHSVPLYLLSPYFHKAALFGPTTEDGLKRISLPFSCVSVSQLIDFAYEAEVTVPEATRSELIQLADYTCSVRLTRYLNAKTVTQPASNSVPKSAN